jgi:adenylate kinase family enzyme
MFAAALAARLGVPHVELDAIFHQPGWQKLEPEEFERRVVEALAGPAWVADGNYRAVLDRIWERADTIVWLDYRRPVVMRRVLWRTLSRAVTRRELWNGNRESWTEILSRDPERSIIRWAWTHHRTYRERYLARLAPGERPAGVQVVRLSSPRHARDLLAAPAHIS